MRVFLLLPAGPPLDCTVPYAGAAYVVAPGACPACGAEPWHVAGTDCYVTADDRAYEARATARCCGAHVGTLRAEPATLFGIHEDRAVLCGRARVY